MNHSAGFRSSTSTSLGPPVTTTTASENPATSARLHIALAVLRAEVRALIDRAIKSICPRPESGTGKA